MYRGNKLAGVPSANRWNRWTEKQSPREEEAMSFAMVRTSLIGILLLALSVVSAGAFEPIGYPASTWGEVAGIKGARHSDFDGLRVDGYVEQGVDLTKIGKTDWVLNTFVGLRFGVNTYHDDYGNRVGPWFGIKLKRDFQPFGNGYGQIAFGLRAESNFHPNQLGTDLQGVAFFQWSAGKDWKK